MDQEIENKDREYVLNYYWNYVNYMSSEQWNYWNYVKKIIM